MLFQLLLDCYGCNKSLLSSKKKILGFLNYLPGHIGMRKISKPFVMVYDSKDDEWGLSGFVFIAESQISVHTYPEKGLAMVDVFSCKKFDVEGVEDYCKSAFGAKELDKKLEKRAVKAGL